MACHRRTFLAIAAAAAGCGLFRSSPPPPPTESPALPLDVEIAAADRLNPDERGHSLPTLVQIYQLKSAAKLEGADFEQLYRNAKETLGSDLLRVEEVTLSPGDKLQRRLDRETSAKAVAVVALFRKPSGTSWRAVADLPPPASRADLRFLIEGYRIERR